MNLLSLIINFNRRLCERLTPIHVHEANVFGVYRKIGCLLLSHPSVKRVVDCGAGKSWHFPGYYKHWYDIHLIGLDIDPKEMEENEDLDEAIICDVSDTIPISPELIDLIMVYSGVEHFHNTEYFLKNAYNALRPNGFLIAQFPGRYAPFAIINRMLPQKISRAWLKVSMRNASLLGFTAHYDRTHYSAFSKIARRAGFKIIYYSPGYYSSFYADCFFPLWLLSYIYDTLRFALGIKNLASYNLFVLQKPGITSDTEPFRLYAWDY